MKKIKLMLLSFSILAVVGGALAFTAKDGYRYCSAPTVGGSCDHACPNRVQLTETQPGIFICITYTIDDLVLTKSTDCQYNNGEFAQCDPVSVNSSIE
jgi:hypothetical protein